MTFVRRTIFVFVLMAGALTTGCRSWGNESPFQRSSNDQVRLDVESSHFNVVTIYAIVGGTNHRLGDVSGKGFETFSIDPKRINLDQGLRISVDPLGSNRGFLSNLVFPNPGSTMSLTVANQVGMSFLTIR
jgi:hypothetical protein